MNPTVEILLSTYNGEKYISEQLESILKQDYTNWKLVVRDDGSTDSTMAILNNHIQKNPERITLIKDNEGNLGYSKSFIKLLRQSTTDYIMYCDQDDYWHPDKISAMLSVMMEEEARLPSTAHIVFSDLEVVNSNLQNTSYQSFLKTMRYSSQQGQQVFFLKNYVPGCNLLFNKHLVKQALKTDNIINLHDHWLLMVGAATGKLTCINKPLMKYRVHDNNAIGFISADTSFLYRLSMCLKECLKYAFNNKAYRKLLYSNHIKQMQNICNSLRAEASKTAIDFSTIDSSSYLLRKMKNIAMPYIIEKSLLKQLTYITCF